MGPGTQRIAAAVALLVTGYAAPAAAGSLSWGRFSDGRHPAPIAVLVILANLLLLRLRRLRRSKRSKR
jgi:hypothetical protein